MKTKIEINKSIDNIYQGKLIIEEFIWRKIVQKMYDPEEANIIIANISTIILNKKKVPNCITKDTYSFENQ